MSSTPHLKYPQMPPFDPQEVPAFLERPLVARMGTLNKDGTIHLAPIFYKYVDGEFLLGTQEISRRVRNLKRNPRVTLLIDDRNPLGAVMIYGTASLEYEDVLPRRIAILERYYSHESAVKTAEWLCATYKCVIIRVKPDRMVSFDYTKDDIP